MEATSSDLLTMALAAILKSEARAERIDPGSGGGDGLADLHRPSSSSSSPPTFAHGFGG
jgi:hypothetical protein